MSIKVGDMVETYGWLEGLTGDVIKITKGYTFAKPGAVEVKITKVEVGPHNFGHSIKAGDIEYFNYYNWETDLRRIS